jgi:HSP20 family protein
MAQSPSDPLEGLLSLGRELDQLLKNFFAGIAPLVQNTRVTVPAVEVLDTPEIVVVRMQIPGVKKDELNLMVHDDALTIKGHMRPEDQPLDTNVCQCEFRYGPFSRRIVLPAVVQSERTTAQLNDGILTVVLPKQSEGQGRDVPIQ